MLIKKTNSVFIFCISLSLLSTEVMADNLYTNPQIDHEKYPDYNWIDDYDPINEQQGDQEALLDSVDKYFPDEPIINESHQNADWLEARSRYADQRSAIYGQDVSSREHNHFYVGAQLGYGFTHLNDKKASEAFFTNLLGNKDLDASARQGGISGRVYGGYQFLPSWALEVGYAKYANAHSKVNISDISAKLSAKNRASAIDAMVVFILPITNKTSFNAKAGVAYLLNQYDLTLSSGEVGDAIPELHSIKAKTFRPKLALGTDYQLNNNLALGLAYEITIGHGKPYHSDVNGTDFVELTPGDSKYAPNLQLVSLNLKYSF